MKRDAAERFELTANGRAAAERGSGDGSPGRPAESSAKSGLGAKLGERGSESSAGVDESAKPPALPRPASALSGRLAGLAETAKAYARAAQADNTRRAYEADWTMFASWLRRQGLAETPPDPEAVGLYLAAQVERGGAELSVATLERRLSGIAWRYRQLGQPLDVRDRHIAT